MDGLDFGRIVEVGCNAACATRPKPSSRQAPGDRKTRRHCHGSDGVCHGSRSRSSGGLLARCAGVHVDFHADRHFNDLRCFPGHFLLPSICWRKRRAARQARAGCSRAQAGRVKTRLRCWTCRNGRRLADVRPALIRLGNPDADLSGIFRLPGGDAPISRPDRAGGVLPESEIATFFVMRGIRRQ